MSKRILIVDDSTAFRKVVVQALEGEGYEVVDAIDGDDALTKLDGTKFNLIVCDVNMPNMDGITFLKKAKEIESYKFTPVCMLTTESDRARMEEGKAAGAQGWIVKPFQPQLLLNAVAKLLA